MRYIEHRLSDIDAKSGGRLIYFNPELETIQGPYTQCFLCESISFRASAKSTMRSKVLPFID
jgi:hypothetical protein